MISQILKNGEYTKELWIDRREKSKSLAWSSVLLALKNIKGEVVDRPKALGDIRGVTYIYGMFYRFGLIDVPDEVKEKMGHAGKAAKVKEKELEEWLRGLEGMDRLVDDYVGDKIPLWEKIMDRQGTVCCTWEKTAFEEGLKVGIRLMMEVYSL